MSTKAMDRVMGAGGYKGSPADREANAEIVELRRRLDYLTKERAEAHNKLHDALILQNALVGALEALARESDFVDLHVLSNGKTNPNGYRLLRYVQAAQLVIRNVKESGRER